MSDYLLIVALKTDQPNIERRMRTILALAEPVEPDTEPCVFGKAVEDLTANDYERLAYFMGESGVERMRIGAVAAQEESHETA